MLISSSLALLLLLIAVLYWVVAADKSAVAVEASVLNRDALAMYALLIASRVTIEVSIPVSVETELRRIELANAEATDSR
jgi:hypothetical protein